jgi:uncharacterized membrane protein YfcA
MKLIFPLFIAMLAMIGLGQWLGSLVPANLVGLAAITGLIIFIFKNPEAEDTMPAETKKQWYALFIIGLIFSFIFGSFWNTSMGGM